MNPTRGALLFCVLLGLLCGVTLSANCDSKLSYSDCEDNGCQVVMGTRCSSSAPAPPCDLNFNNRLTQDCCDMDAGGDHVHYLGCMSPGFVCMTQCMEYLPTGDNYVIWEGCAFTGGDWKDSSTTNECDNCFADVCPDQVHDEPVVTAIIMFAIITFVVAMIILFGVVIFFSAVAVRHWMQLRAGESYNSMAAFEAGPEGSEELREMAPRPAPGPHGPNIVPVSRREDGKINITMEDGSERVVTPQQYQKLYYMQNIKRARLMQQRRMQQQQKRREEQEVALAEESTENDALVTDDSA